MKVADRGVSSIIGVILMVAVVVILAAIVSVAAFGFVSDINEPEPAPNVADTTGEFEAGSDFDQQVVRVTHIAGEEVALEDLEIVVRASGDEMDDTQVRLVNLPPGDTTFDDDSYEGNDDLASGFGLTDGVLFDDSSTWTAGETIKFRIPVGGADFRDPPDLDPSNPEADELEALIIHTPSGAIISEHTFTP